MLMNYNAFETAFTSLTCISLTKETAALAAKANTCLLMMDVYK